MLDKGLIPIRTGEGEHLIVTHREEPTTKAQKIDLLLTDIWNRIIKKYWWLWLILFVIPSIIGLIYYITVTATAKEAINLFFVNAGSFLLSIIVIFAQSILAGVVAFVCAYVLGKKLLHRQRILFDEFNSERMQILTMRKTEEEIILFKDRESWFMTLLKGKLKIFIDYATYSLFEAVGEQKTFQTDNNTYDVLRVYVMPESEMGGEKSFIKVKERWTFNQNYLMNKHDIEEYVLKSQLEGVDPAFLRKTLINLTKRNNQFRQKIAEIEKITEREMDTRFWEYQKEITPRGSFGSQLLQNKWLEVEKSRTGKPDELLKREYLRLIKESYSEEDKALEDVVA